MIRVVEIAKGQSLDDYADVIHLSRAVLDLRREAAEHVPKLSNRRIWMVNSTAQGGGVAEMLPRLIALLRELGVDARWAVIGSDEPEFFALTKSIHNAIHGQRTREFGAQDGELYTHVSRALAREFTRYLAPEDILVVHDPQPAGMGAILRESAVHRAVWRCHIGIDQANAAASEAWQFLTPYLRAYDAAVFSAAAYVPQFLADRHTIITPGIDPFNHKNRDLSPHKLVGILCNAGLMREFEPVLTPPFTARVRRLAANGAFELMDAGAEIGLLFRPIVTQVSRWDRLKGFAPLLAAFAELKTALTAEPRWMPRERRRLELVRLVFAGPDPQSVQDDPEATEVVTELKRAYQALTPEVQRDVALVTLPMQSAKENALVVNALQRCSTLIVQNSLREGFGLTVTEAMWKQVAVLGSSAYGIRQQIRHETEGFLNPEPEDSRALAECMAKLLNDPQRRGRYAENAQRRVHDKFLIFTQLRHWLRLLSRLAQTGAAVPRQ